MEIDRIIEQQRRIAHVTCIDTITFENLRVGHHLFELQAGDATGDSWSWDIER